MRAAREPEPIGSIIPVVVGRWGRGRRNGTTAVSFAWKKAAGKKIGAHTRPRSLYKKTLVVEVDSPAWFYELNTNHKQRLLGELQGLLGKERIKKILFRPKR